MPQVFTATPVGSVVALPDGSKTATVALIAIDGKSKLATWQAHKAIITSWNFDENVNVQFTHTMGNDIYMNVFGNRMGMFTVNGIAFNSTGDHGGGGCTTSPHGVVEIVKWYRDNRASEGDAQRIKVTISGADTIDGYLIAANYRANDPVNWTVEYSMSIATIPR
jgi:hypothetical protein